MPIHSLSRLRGLVPALVLALFPLSAGAQDTVPPAPVPAPAAAPAATVIFAGRVLDRATGRPVPGAQVEFPGVALRGTADSTGTFRVGVLTPGHHDLVVLAQGYQPLAVTVALQDGMPSVDIPLAVPPAEGTVAEFTGLVLDAKTGEPIRNARVEFVGPGRPVLTDAEGGFRIAGVDPGPQMLRVRAPGYPSVTSVVAVEVGMAPALVEMEPDVVMLEGLNVLADRLEQRRRGSSRSSRLVEGTELAVSTAPSMPEFLQQQFGMAKSPCGALGQSGQDGCVLVRGGPVKPTIFIDETPQVGGMDALDLYDPADFERLEVYGGGEIVLLYTTAFLERQARSKVRMLPAPLPAW